MARVDRAIGSGTSCALNRGRVPRPMVRSSRTLKNVLRVSHENFLPHPGWVWGGTPAPVHADRSGVGLVRVVGLEPTRACARQILSLLRLPFRHTRAAPPVYLWRATGPSRGVNFSAAQKPFAFMGNVSPAPRAAPMAWPFPPARRSHTTQPRQKGLKNLLQGACSGLGRGWRGDISNLGLQRASRRRTPHSRAAGHAARTRTGRGQQGRCRDSPTACAPVRPGSPRSVLSRTD